MSPPPTSGRVVRSTPETLGGWQCMIEAGQGRPGTASRPPTAGSLGDVKDAIGPPGQWSVVWMERPARHGHPTVRLACSKPVCGAGTRRADGTRAATTPRALRMRERAHPLALQTARVRQAPEACKPPYARRAGMEGTRALGPRTGELRRSRSLGLRKMRRLHL